MKQMITTEKNNRCAIDTNILVYVLIEETLDKRKIATRLISDSPCISSQVVSEFINVSKRKLALGKIEVLERCTNLLSFCKINSVTIDTLQLAKSIIQKYQLQIFDAIIVASAIESNCSILYSEDFQHEQLFENKLTIINPFL